MKTPGDFRLFIMKEYALSGKCGEARIYSALLKNNHAIKFVNCLEITT